MRTGMFGVEGSGDTSGYGGLVRPVTIPGATARPYGGWFDEVADRLAAARARRRGRRRSAGWSCIAARSPSTSTGRTWSR